MQTDSVHEIRWKAENAIRTLTILSELPPLEMAVPLSPTREGRVWDIQLVTMAMVLSTAPIFSMGTLMAASCGALQPAQPCALLNLGSRQPRHGTKPLELLHSLSSCPASQLVKHSYRSPAALVRSRGCWETGSGRTAHIQQHHWKLPSQSDCLSLTPPSPLSPSLALSVALPLFLRLQSCTPSRSHDSLQSAPT